MPHQGDSRARLPPRSLREVLIPASSRIWGQLARLDLGLLPSRAVKLILCANVPESWDAQILA